MGHLKRFCGASALTCAAILIFFQAAPAGAEPAFGQALVPAQPVSSLSRLTHHLSWLGTDGAASGNLVHFAQQASRFVSRQVRENSTDLGFAAYRFSAKIDGDWRIHRDDRRKIAIKTTNQFDIDGRVALGVAADFKHTKKAETTTPDTRTRDRWTVEPFVHYQIDPSTALRYFAGFRTQAENLRTDGGVTRANMTRWVTGAEIDNEWRRGAWRILPEGALTLSQADETSDSEINQKTAAQASARTKVSYHFATADTLAVIEPYGEARTQWAFETLRAVGGAQTAKLDEMSGMFAAGLKIAARDMPLKGHIRARYDGIGEADDKRWTLGGTFSLIF